MVRRRTVPVFLFALGALLPARVLPRAQTLDDPQELLRAYAAIAAKYRAGNDAAAAELLALGVPRLKTVDALMGRATQKPALLAAETWKPGLLRAAAMLHADVAFRAYEENDQAAFHQHVNAADRVLQVAEQREPGNDFRTRWHVAAGHTLLASADVESARAFLTRSCELLPHEARLRLLCGIALTTYASRLKATPPDLERTLIGRGTRRSQLVEADHRQIATRAALLEVAELHFRQVLTTEATRDEGRLRIAGGHVERGDDSQAEASLLALSELAGPRDLLYITRLMLGGIRERQGLHEDAAKLYRSASALNPEAPKARIALAQLQHATGDRAGSRHIVERVVARRLNPPEDPWTRYPVGFIATPFATLVDLRTEVRR